LTATGTNPVLTIGAGITVRGQTGYLGYDSYSGIGTSTATVVNDGSIQWTSGTVISVSTTLTNNGTVSIDATGNFAITGTLQGGTLTATTGAVISGNPTFNGVTISGNVIYSGATLTVLNGLTLNGTATLTGGGFNFSGSSTLAGAGVVVFGNSSGYNSLTASGTNPVLTIGSGITVRGQTGYLGYDGYSGIGASTATVLNAGTIQWTSGTAISVPTTLANNGTITVDATGTFNLGGTLKNGTLTTTTGAVISGNPTFDGVTISGNVSYTGTTLTILNGLTLNGTVTLNGGGFNFSGSSTLAGTGTVAFGNSSGYNSLTVTGTNPVLTIASGITVRGQTGYLGYDSYSGIGTSTDTVVNQGIIQADVSGGTITINGVNNVLAGSLSAAAGATLALNGSYANAGNTLSLSGAGTITSSATVTGGTINVASGGAFSESGGTLNGVTLSGSVSTTSSANLYVKDGLTLSSGATLTLSNSSILYFSSGAQTLGGSGTVAFAGTSASYIYAQGDGTQTGAAALTIGSGVTIHSGGGSGYLRAYYSYDSLTNQGTIAADAAGESLSLSTSGTLLNSGNLIASAGALSVSVAGLSNTGGITVGPGTTFNVSGNFIQSAAGSLSVVLGGSTASLYGSIAVSGSATLNGTLNVAEANSFTPSTGNVFTVLTYGSATGSFSNYTGLSLPNSTALQPAINSTNVTLTTVTSTTIAPDLRVSGLAINPANPQSSQSVTVNWNDINAGNGSTGTSWTDHVVVTNTTTSQSVATADVPYNAGVSGNIASGGSAAQSYAFALPNGPAGVGNLQISVSTDYYNTVAEYYPGNVGELNNTTTIPAASTLAAYPDLQVSGLALSPTSPQSGQSVTVQWNDANNGNGATPSGANWYDNVQVVNTTTGQTLVNTNVSYNSSTSGVIAAGGVSSLLTYGFTLPNGSVGVGQLQVTVITNAGSSIYEYNAGGTATTNNTATTATTSTLAPYPDLQVSNLAANPASPESGQNVTITWNDANNGNGATPAGTSWYDSVQVVNTTTGQTLANTSVSYNFATFGAIAAGGTSAQQSYVVHLPDGPAGVGQLQVTVMTDAGNAVYEYNAGGTAESNNTATAAATSTLAPYPDLQISGLAVTPLPAYAGRSLTVNWNDFNDGNGGTPTGATWTDGLTLVNTTTGQTLLSTTVAAGGSGSLAAGGTAAQSYTLTLPTGANGAGNLVATVTADVNNDIVEASGLSSGKTDNVTSLSFTSAAVPDPDLTVANLVAGEDDNGVVTVAWNDANAANTSSVNSNFSDTVTLTDTVAGSNYSRVMTLGYNTAAVNQGGLGPIASGASSGLRTLTFQLPQGFITTDSLQVQVQTNANNGTPESNYANDTAIDSVSLPAAYAATVTTTATTVVLHSTVSISGHAAFTTGGDNAAQKPLTVRVVLNGTPTLIPVTTDASGNFATTFTPTQTGVYGLAVAPPLSNINTIQAQFNVTAISGNSAAPQTIIPGTPVNGSLTVFNLGPVSLAGLTAIVSGAHSNLSVQVSIPNGTISAYGSATINYTLSASDSSTTYEPLTFNVSTDIGATTSIPLSVNITPQGPQLTATPPSLNTGMLVGQQTLVTFSLTNIGTQPTGDLMVTLPQTSYLNLSAPAAGNPVVPSIAPGASASVTLQLLPPADLTLAQYTGNIEFSNTNLTFLEPFNFRAITSSVGDVQVSATDHVITGGVVDASVQLLDPYDNTVIVAQGTTATGGSVDLGNVMAGTYLLQVSAADHTQSQQTISVLPGVTNQESAYLPAQTVTYSWVVTKSPVTQQYSIVLQANFKTNVPAPVVIMTSSDIPTLGSGASGDMTLTFVNHGLIAAQNVLFTVPSDPQYSFVPAIPVNSQGQYVVGAVPANATVTIPLTVTNYGQTGTACHLVFTGDYQFQAGDTPDTTVVDPMMASVEVPGRVCTPQTLATLPGLGAPEVDPTPPPGQGFDDGDGSSSDGGGGGGGGGGSVALGGAPILPPIVFEQGVSATVSIEIDQTAVITANAFKGTLGLTDELPQALTDVGFNLNVTDANGNPVGGAFFIETPTLGGQLTAIDGTGMLAAFGTGTAQYVFIPTNTAAPTAPTMYSLGGIISYVDPTTGQQVSIQLYPKTITVDPLAQVKLDYFLQRDVFSDDPFTPQIEPAEPFYLGLLASNVGYGTAQNFSITSAQPQIISNDKGLEINFSIIGTQVGTQPVDPSLTVNLGDLAPGQTESADFMLTATLQGEFTGFDGTYTADSPGGAQTSQIIALNTHTLIHTVQTTSDNQLDFLAADTMADSANDVPDTLYKSDGTVAPVNVATNVQTTGSGAAGLVTVTATEPVGWNYIEVADPGVGYTIGGISGPGGVINSRNYWTTDRIFQNGAAAYDNLLHVLVYNPTAGTGSYVINYQEVPVTVTSVVVNGNNSALAGTQRSMVNSLVYTFSEPVNLAAGGAFTIAIHNGEQGIVPTLAWTALSPDVNGASAQWVVTFSGASVVGSSIANGVYDITLNTTAVSSEAHPTASITPRATDTFYRLYGDYNGDQVVNASDNLRFKAAITAYNAIFDYDGNGAVNATDNLHFKSSISFVFNALFTTTI
jgi:hypothetical protein